MAQWEAGDALGDVLALPRAVSVSLVADSGHAVRRVVDLGAGPGAFLEAFLDAFPGAAGTWIDSSAPMAERAEERLGRFGDRVRLVRADVRRADALGAGPADVVVSSRVIHHFEPETIRVIYGAAFDRLRPGGFLFNLDHVGPPPEWEPRYRRVRTRFVPGRGDRPPHGHDAPPQPLEDHLAWLAEAGFEPPDVPWRLFFTALIAARKPPSD